MLITSLSVIHFLKMIFRYRSINNSIIQISANTTCKNGQPDEVVEWRIFCYFSFWFFQNLTKDILSFPPVVAARNPKFYSPVWMGRKIVAMSPGNERKKQRKCFSCFKFSLRICLKKCILCPNLDQIWKCIYQMMNIGFQKWY